MARETRSSRFCSIARRASSMLVAVVFALSIVGHGFGERVDEHLSPLADIALTIVSAEAHNTPSDALCAHVHSEHHQIAPCVVEQGGLQQREARIAYAFFDARATSRESAPPHGPPKA